MKTTKHWWKKTQIHGKLSHVYVLKDLVLLKCPYYAKQYSSVQSLSKSQWHFFTEIEKNNPKIHRGPQRTLDSWNNLKKKEQAGGITLPGFKIYYKTTVIETVLA